MEIRCAPGMLAMVIRDTLPCRENLGRIVQVRGPLELSSALRLPSWLIKPVRNAPYAVEFGRKLVVTRVYWKMSIEHPDAWLLPLEGTDLARERQAVDTLPLRTIPLQDWDAALAETLRRYTEHDLLAGERIRAPAAH